MATQITFTEKCSLCHEKAQFFFWAPAGKRRSLCCFGEPYATVLTLPESQPVTQSPPSYGRHGVGTED